MKYDVQELLCQKFNLSQTSIQFNSNFKQLFPNNLYQYPFAPFAVKFTVEDLFPRAEIQFSAGNGNNHFTAHDGAFQMGIGIVFKTIVPVLRIGFFRCKFFKPDFKIMMQTRFIIIDKYAAGDMHGIA